MIRAQLRYLHSPDVYDLATFMPEDPGHFGILVQAIIGPEGEAGEESFDMIVCSPQWLVAHMREQRQEYEFGHHYLFLLQYDYAALKGAIEALCRLAVGKDWDAIGSWLGYYGKWEFEDYVPYVSPDAGING